MLKVKRSRLLSFSASGIELESARCWLEGNFGRISAELPRTSHHRTEVPKQARRVSRPWGLHELARACPAIRRLSYEQSPTFDIVAVKLTGVTGRCVEVVCVLHVRVSSFARWRFGRSRLERRARCAPITHTLQVTQLLARVFLVACMLTNRCLFSSSHHLIDILLIALRYHHV